VVSNATAGAGGSREGGGTPGGAGFPRAVRLLTPAEFARVYEFRRSAAEGPLVLHAAPAVDGGAAVRLGLSVSRRVGGAVERNRWKRRLREAFRRVRARLPPGNDFVVVVRPAPVPMAAAGARRVEESLVSLATRVVGRPGYSRGGPRPDGPAADSRPRRRGR
jgi:ribonuclease P protein component